ncbi:zinc protease [Fulvitalea axinellae]|uniref:Zinc protease n=1 Tax=Fulvitalea axinellae TaxID=1182444 RepID=A0AAU9D172_9BACT|nr:zinc protease [Fulvitalea axinellae]
MKLKSFRILASVLLALVLLWSCSENSEKKQGKYKYKYERVDNDPYGALIYTLDNGMKIFMSVNKRKPRIFTEVAIRTGSKKDPHDATGLAHYLEHMMFKGTSKIAALDWKDEKPLLDRIEALYEERRGVTDEKARDSIYHIIDSVSYIASGYVATNEYDKMVSVLGAQGTNAYTWTDQTVYINSIPSNELEKWMRIAGERFHEVVLRLFHTELEAVYEEYNRGLDSDYQQVMKKMLAGLFMNHPYGTQSTIGTAEDLKNPSMKKIYEYFHEYYVANNMALVMAGDFNPDEVVDFAKKYFVTLPKREVPKFTYKPEDENRSPVKEEVIGPNAEFVQIGYRMPGGKDPVATAKLEVLDAILSNGKAGLIDLNLNQSQKVLGAGSSPIIWEDYSILTLRANPKNGQTLEQVKDLLMQQITDLKTGNFEDWLVQASVRFLKLQEIQGLESNENRTEAMKDAFILGVDWKNTVGKEKVMSSLTKQDIVDFANKYLNNNYAVVYKRQGKIAPQKFKKPKITPIQVNRDRQSQFYASIDSMEVSRIKPEFVDFKSAISEGKLKNDIPISYIKNESNQLFNLVYLFDMGTDNDKELDLMASYLPFLGTSKYSAEDLKKEFFKLGVNFGVSSSNDRTYVYLSGLEESLEAGVPLFEHILSDVKKDQTAYDNLVGRILKGRLDGTLNKGNILYSGLMSYAQYGKDSRLRNIIPAHQLKTMDPQALVDKVHGLSDYKHRIFYYGPNTQEGIGKVLEKDHKPTMPLKAYPPKKEYKELAIDSDRVFYSNYDMAQTEMIMFGDDQIFDPALMPMASLFNQYFGGGLSSIVFQEIRESKALAYSVYSAYSQAGKKGKRNHVIAYIGTQVDKLPEAVSSMKSLMNDMPEAEKQFNEARFAAMKDIEARRIVGSDIFWTYESLKKRGIDYDISKEIYAKLKTATLPELKAFFDKHVKGKKYAYLVIGNESKMDFEVLKQLGDFEQLTIEDLFGYDAESLKKEMAQ